MTSNEYKIKSKWIFQQVSVLVFETCKWCRLFFNKLYRKNKILSLKFSKLPVGKTKICEILNFWFNLNHIIKESKEIAFSWDW